MILQCNFEEVSALRAGARTLLSAGVEDPCVVAAPPVGREQVEALLSHSGELRIGTLAEQRSLEAALTAVVACLRAEMDALVASTHPASEGAVAAYFDFAHVLSVLSRVRDLGSEMAALIEVVTGEPPTEAVASTFAFPD